MLTETHNLVHNGRPNPVDVIFNFVSSILLHEGFMNPASKCYFTTDLETTENLRVIKG